MSKEGFIAREYTQAEVRNAHARRNERRTSAIEKKIRLGGGKGKELQEVIMYAADITQGMYTANKHCIERQIHTILPLFPSEEDDPEAKIMESFQRGLETVIVQEYRLAQRDKKTQLLQDPSDVIVGYYADFSGALAACVKEGVRPEYALKVAERSYLFQGDLFTRLRGDERFENIPTERIATAIIKERNPESVLLSRRGIGYQIKDEDLEDIYTRTRGITVQGESSYSGGDYDIGESLTAELRTLPNVKMSEGAWELMMGVSEQTKHPGEPANVPAEAIPLPAMPEEATPSEFWKIVRGNDDVLKRIVERNYLSAEEIERLRNHFEGKDGKKLPKKLRTRFEIAIANCA